jgi:hypothetical protein
MQRVVFLLEEVLMGERKGFFAINYRVKAASLMLGGMQIHPKEASVGVFLSV